MKLETFFEKFDQFSDASDAVAKMRELVLEFAVQGSLTSPLPNDGTVPSVVEFRECAAALADSLGLRSPKESVEVVKPLFDVPSHWRWLALADIGAAQTGTTPSKADHDAFNGDVPFIKPADILSSSIDYSNESLTRLGAESGSRLAPKGSLLMVCIGTIGKCNLIERECAFNQQINSLTPVGAVDSRYLLAAVRSRSFQDAAWKKSSSTTIAILNKGKWLSIPVPLPPLAEQKRIVAKVDELMALCDRLEAQQQERATQHAALARASLARFAEAPTPANLQYLFHPSYTITPADLRKSILTLAVQGKLVPQDPNDEPAALLLERIDDLPKRALRTRGADECDVCEPNEFEPLFELPSGWEWATFRRLPLQASVGIDRGRAMQGRDKAVGYFKMNNIRNFGGVDLGDLARIDATPGEIEAFALADGDFLFNTRNSRELVGKTCVFRVLSDDPILYNNNILRVKFIDGFSADFLDYWFRSPEGSGELEKLKSNTTNVCAIYQGKLSGFPCVVPPIAEQHRIVAKVDQLMTLVDKLETQLAASRATATNLLSAIVAELTSS